ncbi:hypothetical protein CORC01_13275 [Colletotrichum orchidophilum]|uniref:DNA/RNA-binding domain-containing protein n=1 Tax=Colletotrichum orchidophilum TaxID=1209926 RepID=A0A1G4AQG1_9PEZI|nr:uncharacterized protein CORC01_13275 [Colletotrichum orchidophilum]OHE91410.1 hypothetical protein CORC01_13275 [Colletotrichum orchidophilum]
MNGCLLGNISMLLLRGPTRRGHSNGLRPAPSIEQAIRGEQSVYKNLDAASAERALSRLKNAEQSPNALSGIVRHPFEIALCKADVRSSDSLAQDTKKIAADELLQRQIGTPVNQLIIMVLRVNNESVTQQLETTGGTLLRSIRTFDPKPPRFEHADEMVKELEIQPPSQQRLEIEVNSIYDRLVVMENECIEADKAQFSNNETNPRLNHKQWQALNARHNELLNEYHDFFLASHDPSASPDLCRRASEYAMPARFRKHGMQSFLELLHHRLPDSLDHMLSFINLVYSKTALLYEMVPAFEDTWIECLGDLGIYRMGIKDDDFKDSEVWTSVSRHWHSKASDKSPTDGRLYHQLAICAKPNTLQQLFYYTKSLCAQIPFLQARDSLTTFFSQNMNEVSDMPVPARTGSYDSEKSSGVELTNEVVEALNLDPIDDESDLLESASVIAAASEADTVDIDVVVTETTMLGVDEDGPVITVAFNDEELGIMRVEAVDINTAFVRAHGLLFSEKNSDQFSAYSEACTKNLAGYIERSTCRWMEHGYQISIVLGCALLEYEDVVLPKDDTQATHGIAVVPTRRFFNALDFVSRTHRTVFGLTGNSMVYPYLHVTLVFLRHMSQYPGAMVYIEERIPWKAISLFLNKALESFSCYQKIESEDFPVPADRDARPLPEDFAQRGLLWVEKYYPTDWFTGTEVECDKRFLELSYMVRERADRCLWLGCRLAKSGKWLKYDKTVKLFHVESSFDDDPQK